MRALWNGQLPLAQAFWEYAVIYALLLNICATVAAFAFVAADLPAALAIGFFLLPVPYVVVAVVGVWRSAAAYAGPQHWATLARAASVLWGAIMVLT
jgi:hypothetical protein